MSKKLSTINPENVFDSSSPIGSKAVRQVVNMVIDGRFAPGEAVRESVLATEMGISRNAVREALNQLVSIDVMEYVPYCGYRLMPYTIRDLLEWHEIRLGLEPVAVKLACWRQPVALFDELDAILDSAEIYLKAGEYKHFWRHDYAFHLKLAESSCNRRMAGMFYRGALAALATEYYNKRSDCPNVDDSARECFQAFAPGTAASKASDDMTQVAHRQLVEFLRKRDEIKAVAAITEHIQLICRTIYKYLETKSFLSYETSAEMSCNNITPFISQYLNK